MDPTLRPDIGPLFSPSWNWEKFFQLAATELVLPTLCVALSRLCPLADLPNEVRECVAVLPALAAERNQALLREVLIAAKVLNTINIQPILLKGSAYFVAGVYGSDPVRFAADIDILVPPSAMLPAVTRLASVGYRPEVADPLNVSHQHPPLLSERGFDLDVHRHLGVGSCVSILPAQDVMSDVSWRHVGGAHVGVPSPTHLVTHQIMHSQIHDRSEERIRPSLRTMLDLVSLTKYFAADVQWSEVAARFRKVRRYNILAAHLAAVAESLGYHPCESVYLTPLARLRLTHRRMLTGCEGLQRIDPMYFAASSIAPRLRLVGGLLKSPKGRQYLMTRLFHPGLYRNLLSDFRSRR